MMLKTKQNLETLADETMKVLLFEHWKQTETVPHYVRYSIDWEQSFPPKILNHSSIDNFPIINVLDTHFGNLEICKKVERI